VSLSMQSHLATVNFSFSNHSSVFKVSRWNWKDGKRWNVRECLFFVPWNQKVAEGARRYEGGKCGKINHICAFSHIIPWPRGGKGGRTSAHLKFAVCHLPFEMPFSLSGIPVARGVP
jgi:hypothetical protein